MCELAENAPLLIRAAKFDRDSSSTGKNLHAPSYRKRNVEENDNKEASRKNTYEPSR